MTEQHNGMRNCTFYWDTEREREREIERALAFLGSGKLPQQRAQVFRGEGVWGDVAVEGGLQPLLKLREEGARAAGQEERERGEPSSHPVHSAQTREERLKHHHICV